MVGLLDWVVRLDNVSFDAYSWSGATGRAKFAKGAASKNNYREAECNKLTARRQVEVASYGDTGFVIVSKSSGRRLASVDADTAPVHVSGANELMENCVYHGMILVREILANS
uniref:Uncharacterized protein n=1 Tax=Glossina palpalis gambiensis TaxID=67801 RepID=A0A1B0BLK5_9MUSC